LGLLEALALAECPKGIEVVELRVELRKEIAKN
jgi:hypothetical protein